MNEPEFARLARQYIKMIEGGNAMKPPGWSQADHTAEHQLRMDLLDRMRTALGPRALTYQEGLGRPTLSEEGETNV